MRLSIEIWLLTVLFVSLILICLYFERFSLIVVKRKEVVTVTSVLYSCKTLKTPKINRIVAMGKRGKLTRYG